MALGEPAWRKSVSPQASCCREQYTAPQSNPSELMYTHMLYLHLLDMIIIRKEITYKYVVFTSKQTLRNSVSNGSPKLEEMLLFCCRFLHFGRELCCQAGIVDLQAEHLLLGTVQLLLKLLKYQSYTKSQTNEGVIGTSCG